MVDSAKNMFEQDWKPTEKDIRIDALAERYHAEAEAYDRIVCNGPILHGAIMPLNLRELSLINNHASMLFRQIMKEADQHGISEKEMRRAIARHEKPR
jgi:hypothetical protein